MLSVHRLYEILNDVLARFSVPLTAKTGVRVPSERQKKIKNLADSWCPVSV
jgi:hypothetical protein